MMTQGRLNPAGGSVGPVVLAAVILGLTAPRARGDAEWYAGIDVGTKGIKSVALPIDEAGQPDLARVVRKLPHKALNNVAIGALKNGQIVPEALEEAGEAIRDFYEQFTRGDGQGRPPIKPENIWIVASSGLVQLKPTNLDALRTVVREATGGAKQLDQVTEKREASLTLLGTIPRELWDTSIQIDVGSGNVKCGYLIGEQAPHVQRPFVPPIHVKGTIAYRQSIEEELKKAGARVTLPLFSAKLKERRRSLVDEVEEQVGRYPGILNPERRRIYLSGGSPYVIASRLHPLEMARSSVQEVRFTIDELRGFIDVLRNTEEFPKVRLDGLSEDDRKLVQKQVRDAGEVFSDTASVLAGAEILLAFNEALHWEQKEVYFAKSGLVAWIVGFVVEERAKHAAKAANLSKF